MSDWIRCSDRLPPVGIVVETKIDDRRGVRNETKLKLVPECGRLWFVPDSDMYVYYTPTHWREVASEEVA